MNIRLIIILLISLSYILFENLYFKYKSSYNKRLLMLSFICLLTIILIFISGLRNIAVGADTYAYYLIFEEVKNLSWGEILSFEGRDPGYNFLQKVFQVVINNYRFFMIFVVTVFYTGFARLVYINASNIKQIWFSYIVFIALFLDFSFTGLRQVLCLGVVMFSIELIQKRKLFWFLIVTIIFSFLHKTILIFIPFYYIAVLRNSKRNILVVILIAPILFLFSKQIARFMVEISGVERYMMYVDASYEGSGTPTFTLMIFSISVFYLLRVRQIALLGGDSLLFANSLALSLFFVPITWVDPTLMRVAMYFTCLLPILLAYSLDSLKLTKVNFVIRCFAISVLMLLFLKTKTQYDFFWNPMRLGDNYEFAIIINELNG